MKGSLRGFIAAGVFVSGAAIALAQGAALTFDTPPGWVAKKPSSSMRVAEFTLPRAENDKEDATVTVFYFGGQGGNIQANIDRWLGQMVQPNGKPSKDVATTQSLQTVSGLKITILDVSGTYVAEVTPGSPEKFNKPGFRQCAAYIETPNGPYFAKLVGPSATVSRWYKSFALYLRSAK